MPRGTTLANARAMLKAEIGDYAGTNAVSDAARNVQMSNMQKWFASEYDWPFLEHEWPSPVSAGSQFLTMPATDKRGMSATINFERGVLVERLYNNLYVPLDYGIGADEYNIYDYLRDGKAMDPIQRWKFSTNTVDTANSNQYEVWPVPVTAQTVRFTGQRKLLALSSDSDTLDMDDMLIVLSVAAMILMRNGTSDAQMMSQRAQRTLERLRAHYPTYDRTIILGGGGHRHEKRRLVGIAVAS